MIEAKLQEAIIDILKRDGVDVDQIDLEPPTDIAFGDLTTNVALAEAKRIDKSPREFAEQVAEQLEGLGQEYVERVEVAGPGFINIFLTRSFFTNELDALLKGKFGRDDKEVMENGRILIEYTDPNPFKVFHIGHLMQNTVGESIARLSEESGAEVKRLCYQGDVGMHVAKSVWGILQDTGNMPAEDDPLVAKMEFLGNAYALGAATFEEDDEVRRAIQRLNKEIYERTNEEAMNLYHTGRRWSLAYFETIYERLGTRFDEFFFESDMADAGRDIVRQYLGDVFEEGEGGAIVYPGERKGLHTRVFLNAEGLPTYEAKDLALAHAKDRAYDGVYDTSIIITAEEQREYFKVVLSALEDITPELAHKTEHITHGMMKLSTGKMSSRLGNVTSAEELIALVSQNVEAKMEGRVEEADSKRIAEEVALGAIKFWILRQATGKDIAFDMDQAISLEGDSGPYIQYAAVRAQSVLDRALAEGVSPELENVSDRVNEIEKELFRFERSVERALEERAPHHIAHALLRVASAFNRFYGEETIADAADPLASYRAALTYAVRLTLKRGLHLLGIRVPERM